jgi:hypothetical protein
MTAIKGKYPGVRIHELPDSLVYPFDSLHVSAIFKETHALPPDTIGIHWFGGHKMAQEYNAIEGPLPPCTLTQEITHA